MAKEKPSTKQFAQFPITSGNAVKKGQKVTKAKSTNARDNTKVKFMK